MDLGFPSVAAVTVGVLGGLLAVVTGLRAGGLAEVRWRGYRLAERERERDGWTMGRTG